MSRAGFSLRVNQHARSHEELVNAILMHTPP
jgi:hypothetical protein